VAEGRGHDRFLDAAGIPVRNLDGTVALTGTVPSYPQYLEPAGHGRGNTVTLVGHVRTRAKRDAVTGAA
jgi:osmotically-inducible protein OsmY